MFKRLLAIAPRLLQLPRFASQCAVCRSWPAQPVCPPCLARFVPLERRCAGCAIALAPDISMAMHGAHTGPDLCMACVRTPPQLDSTLAAVSYAYPWSTLIADYKFADQHGWADFFAGILLKTPGVREALSALDANDWILPMPLSAERLESRGFNQSWELGNALARQAQAAASTDARLLLRVKHTRPQSQLKREARLANVKGAFQVDPLRTAEVSGRRVVLVDDVMTSGASLFTAAGALRSAGAKHVTAIVLARTAPA